MIYVEASPILPPIVGSSSRQVNVDGAGHGNVTGAKGIKSINSMMHSIKIASMSRFTVAKSENSNASSVQSHSLNSFIRCV